MASSCSPRDTEAPSARVDIISAYASTVAAEARGALDRRGVGGRGRRGWTGTSWVDGDVVGRSANR